MAGIIFSTTNSGLSATENAELGRIATPLKMIIEDESDAMENEKGACDLLFNVETSDNFAETVVGMDTFDTFDAVKEGEAAPADTVSERFKKYIEHIQYMKEFSVTRVMAEDAKTGISSNDKRKAQAFTRAYYKTRNTLAARALANGTVASMTAGNEVVDLKAPDGNPLFYKHTLTSKKGATANNYNYYWGSCLGSAAEVQDALGRLAVAIRNMKSENGDPLGFVADTIILPGNRGVAEGFVKAALGSQQVTGSGNNDINIQYGNWNLIILPEWQATDDRMIVMSSAANKQLAGNMFFNRIPLTVDPWIDHHTATYKFTGRCRFGLGFASYKHAILCVDANSDPTSGAAAALSSLS